MVIVMKRIFNYVFYTLTVSFLVFLMTTMNSPSLLVVSHNSVYATPQQEDESSSENNDSSPDANEGHDTTQENGVSEQSERSNNEENSTVDSSDSSPSDQSNTCPNTDTNDFANVPTYIGQDGCVYPCPSSEDQSSIPQGCPVESPQQATSGFSINEERPIQPQQQEQQQSKQPPQQNTQTNPNQNTLTSPRINNDTTIITTSNIPTTETTITTTQKSLNPADQFKSGSGLTGLNIPKSFYDPAVPFNPGAGNAGMKGSSIIPNTNTNTNPLTPVEPGNVSSKIGDRWAHLTVYSNSTTAKPVEICVFISDPYEVRANPYCIEASPHGTLHILQAPGLIGIRASSNVDKVDTSNCEFRIYPKESKSCVLNITDSPFLKSKSETSGQDRLRTPIG
jgi:hypothetical protein